MTVATHSQRERFIAEVLRRAPAADYDHTQRLMRYAGTFGRLTEKVERTMQDEKKLDKTRQSIRDLVFDIRCQVTFDGLRVTIRLPDGFLIEVPRV